MKNIELRTSGIQEMGKDEAKAYSGGFVGTIGVAALGIGVIGLAIAIWGMWICVKESV